MKIENQGFRFVQTTTTVMFDELENVRINSDQLDKELSDFFQTPGASIAIGPGVDPNIPRLQYPSKSGHSVLSVSNVAAQLITNIDAAWEKDFGKISNYCIEREASLEKVLAEIGAKLKWVGWSVKLQKSLGTPDHKDFVASQFIKKHFFKDEAVLGHSGDPCEVAHKIAFIEQDRFYFNFHASNFKSYSYQLQLKANERIRIVNPALRDMKFEEQGVEFFLDVNSKYAYDLGPVAQHMNDDFTKIITLTSEFIGTRLGSKQWN